MKILHTDFENYPPEAMAALETLGEVVRKKPATREGFLRLMRDAEILIVRMDTAVDREALDAAPLLKIVGSATTGINHLDVAVMKERGIALITLRGEGAFLQDIPSTAEHTMGLILSLVRNIPWSFDAARRGEWESFTFQGRELKGQALGLIGCGRVGVMVAGYAKSFGMRVRGYDPYREKEALEQAGIASVSLGTLLRESDIVSLHPLLTRETENMIGAKELALMKKSAFLVNTARGELVDEEALLTALGAGMLAGAATDVVRDEKQLYEKHTAHPMLAYAASHHNLLITPHIAGMAIESVRKTSDFIARKVVEAAHRIESRGR